MGEGGTASARGVAAMMARAWCAAAVPAAALQGGGGPFPQLPSAVKQVGATLVLYSAAI